MNAAWPAVTLLENPIAFIARPTPQLQVAVRQQQTTLPPEEFAAMMAAIKSVFDKYTAKLLEFAPGLDRGTALHQLMDRELKVTAQFALSCHKGCSGCCHYEVEITQDEAAILKNIVIDGLPVDLERLQLQAARERQSPEWQRFGSPNNRCVFLSETGVCRVYNDRPSICRKHVVTTPVSACTTAGEVVAPVQVLLAEILLSAELSLPGTKFGSLAKMLWQALPQTKTRRALKTDVLGKIRLRVARNQPAGSRTEPLPHHLTQPQAKGMLLQDVPGHI